MSQEMKFLSTRIDVETHTVGQLISMIESGAIIIDPEAQRKLSPSHAKGICKYLRDALEGKSLGAYFPAITASRRPNGIVAILDGQHRFFGAWEAIKQIQKEIKKLSKTDPVDESKLEMLREHESLILESVIPMTVYIDLLKEQEQQAFHDFNQKGKKVSTALALSFNHSDPMVNLTRLICDLEEIKPYVQPLQSGTKLKPEYLFTFSTVLTTVTTFFGNKKSLEGFDLDVMISEMQDFFHIVQETFPEDVLSDRYLYRHAGTLPGIALFAKRMKDIEGVSWRNTLRNALGSVPFSTDNVHFVRYGRASYNSEGKVQFTGSKGAISAVVKTLEQLAVWLDENGNEALWAYQTNRKEEMVKIISEEEAERKAEEVARMTEQESNTEYDTAPVDEDLSASERVVLSAIEKAENKSITGSFTQFASQFNFARSTITDAIKKLESKNKIKIVDENGLKTLVLV